MGKKTSSVVLEHVASALPELLLEEQAIQVQVEGLPPGLLMNSARSMLLQEKIRKKGDLPSPEIDAESRVYRKANRELYIPGTAFYGTLIGSSTAYKLGRRSTTQLVAGTVRVWPEEIGLGTDKYEIDMRTVVIQRSRIVRARPWLREWSANFYLIYDPSFGITADLLKKMFEEAGRRIGVLDFRPQHRGQFGRFVIKAWKELARRT